MIHCLCMTLVLQINYLLLLPTLLHTGCHFPMTSPDESHHDVTDPLGAEPHSVCRSRIESYVTVCTVVPIFYFTVFHFHDFWQWTCVLLPLNLTSPDRKWHCRATV